MNTIKKVMLAIVLLVGMVLVATPAQAYFYQPQSYPNYSPNPYRYGYQDTVSQLVQGHLNFVSNFVYYPAPVRSYFNPYFPSYSYGGYGNNYGYNYGY